MLKGNRVILRPMRRSDINYFLKWFTDPEVTQYLAAIYLPMTEMADEKFIEELGTSRSQTQVIFVIEATEGESNIPIGNTTLSAINPKDHLATFGIAIGEKAYWSKGYGTEAARLLVNYGFEQLNLHRISSGAVAFNERSIRMHLSVGFREEGRERELLFKNGKFHDYVIFGLLRAEWKSVAVR